MFELFRSQEELYLKSVSMSTIKAFVIKYKKIGVTMSLDENFGVHEVSNTLNSFLRLKDDWEEGGEKFIREELIWGQHFIIEMLCTAVKTPYIYPMCPRDIDLEWTNGRLEIVLEIYLKDRKAHYSAFNMDTEKLDSRNFDLQDPVEINSLREVLKCAIH